MTLGAWWAGGIAKANWAMSPNAICDNSSKSNLTLNIKSNT